jgi:hypothetical protein
MLVAVTPEIFFGASISGCVSCSSITESPFRFPPPFPFLTHCLPLLVDSTHLLKTKREQFELSPDIA